MKLMISDLSSIGQKEILAPWAVACLKAIQTMTKVISGDISRSDIRVSTSLYFRVPGFCFSFSVREEVTFLIGMIFVMIVLIQKLMRKLIRKEGTVKAPELSVPTSESRKLTDNPIKSPILFSI